MLKELRHALRVLWRSPAFTVPTLLLLIPGIAFTTTLFSVLFTLLMRPLPFTDDSRIVLLTETLWVGRTPYKGSSLADVDRWRAAKIFSDIAAFSWRKYDVQGSSEPVRAAGLAVEPGFFSTLGVYPELGRLPDQAVSLEENPIVISYSLWDSYLRRDPNAVGRRLLFGDRPVTIVGVMPRRFSFPLADPLPGVSPAFWEVLDAPTIASSDRNERDFEVVARLSSGDTIRQAQAKAISVLKEGLGSEDRSVLDVLAIRDSITGDVRPVVLLLTMSNLCVLLILVVNLTNLTIARSIRRSKEIAIRYALGASRRDVLRHLVVESCSLGILAGSGALGVSLLLIRLLPFIAPEALPRAVRPELDFPMLGFSISLALLLSAIATIYPAMRISADGLHNATQCRFSSSSTRWGRRIQKYVITGQVALSLILLVGAGLLIRSLGNLQAINPGFRTEGVLTGRLSLTSARYTSAQQMARFHHSVLERVTSFGGVASAALTMTLPFSGRSSMIPITIGDSGAPGNSLALEAERNVVTNEYFTTMGVQFLAGRKFEESDHSGAPIVAVINKSLAKRCWPGRDSIGRQFRFGKAPSSLATVVGLVEDEKHWAVTDAAEPEFYLRYEQAINERTSAFLMKLLTFIVVQAKSEPSDLMLAVKQAVRDVDANQPVDQLIPMKDLVLRSLGPQRVRTTFLFAYGFLALMLTVFGIYSIVAYVVGDQERELGIRIALGATRLEIVRLVLSSYLAYPILLGVILGGLGSIAAGRTIAGFLYGVPPLDGITYTSVAGLLLFAGGLAGCLGASHVLRIEPGVILKQE